MIGSLPFSHFSQISRKYNPMSAIILIAMMQVSAWGAEQTDIEQACRQSQATGRPLVVLIGAVWCPACQKMRNSILPQVAETGGLEKVIFTYLDYDQHQQLASRLSQGTSIPQLIRFDPTPAGWKSKYLIGAKSPGVVCDFINAGLPGEEKAEDLSNTDQRANDWSKSHYLEAEVHGPLAADHADHARRLTPEDARTLEKSGRTPSDLSAGPNDSRNSTPGNSIRPTPAAVKTRTSHSVDALRDRQGMADSYWVERSNGYSIWRLLFPKRPDEYRSWHNGTVYYYPYKVKGGAVYYYPCRDSNPVYPYQAGNR
jgi:thiol-disulfide isomerase/thioredoxin